MAESPTGGSDIFDVRKIRRLVELMNDHDLSEIDLRDGPLRIRLRKRYEQAPVAIETRPVIASLPAHAETAPAAAPSEQLAVIKSIMIGTFFAAPNPESPPYVKVGDHVGPETVVCIIEAMKVFNEIPAGVSGKIVAVLVANGDPVEFGQPLFKVDTRQ